MKKIILFVLYLIFITNLSLYSKEGVIYLLNGNKLKGDIFYYTNGDYIIKFKNGYNTISSKEIKKIIYNKNFKNKYVLKNKYPYEDIINKYCYIHGIQPELIAAIIDSESNFNPKAVSCKNAKGLMQLIPSTAKTLKVKNIYNPEENISAGVKHFKHLLFKFNGDIEKSIAAYNAGIKPVEKYKGIPPYKETKIFVKNVYNNHIKYIGHHTIYSYKDPQTGVIHFFNK